MNQCPSIKNIKKALDSNSYLLVIEKGKYGNKYDILVNSEEFTSYFANLLKERFESGEYFFDPTLDAPKLPSMSMEQAKSLPEGNPKIVALDDLRIYEEELARFSENLHEWNIVQEALKSNDGWKSYTVLGRRSLQEYEYEGIDVIVVPKYKKKQNGQ